MIVLPLLLIAMMASNRAQGATPGYSFSQNPITSASLYNIGFEFTPTNSFDVTALGYWDSGSNGLAASHQVAIYFATNYSTFVAGNQVPGAFATVLPVDSGSALDIGTPANGFYAYHSLAASVRLEAGVHYRIAANTYNTADTWSYESPASQTNLAPMITGAGVYVGASSTNMSYPTTVNGSTFYSAPNFLFTSVPEPGMVAMMVFGGLIVFTAARRAQGKRTGWGRT